MKNFLTTLLKQLLRTTGDQLLASANDALQVHVDNYDKAIDAHHSEVFMRADENDKLRAKIKANTALNVKSLDAIRQADATRTRIAALIGS